MRYYLIRVFDDNGNPLATRCERAKGPREACKLAFGTVYDKQYHTAVYKDIGTRKPAYLSQKVLNALQGLDGWTKIPATGD